jgi:hypothetical protein
LLPSEFFKYIPLWAFPNLRFEITLNPYAFYSSGYFVKTSNELELIEENATTATGEHVKKVK